MVMRSLAKFRDDSRATALVEMAIVMPFLLVLGLGVFEIGNFLYQYQLVEAGVRDAARYMARVTNTDSTSPAYSLVPCDPTVLASKVANAKDIAVTGSIGGTSKRVPWQSATDITVDYATTVANGLIGGYPSFRGPLSGIRIIKVTATPTYLGVGFLNSLGLTTMTLNVAHSERCIGQG